MNRLINCIFLLFIIAGICSGFRTQFVSVKGKLRCGGALANNVNVKLIDQDTGPDPDDWLDQGVTNEAGEFSLTGSSMEISNIEPELRIQHDCNDKEKLCHREWIIKVPTKYIYADENSKKVLDVGTLNLEVELENEDKDCVEMHKSIYLLLTVFVCALAVQKGKQSYRVKGFLMCGSTPAKDVQVKLIDDDFGSDPDDDLDSAFTDVNGYFDLSGNTVELTTIDPHLKIYHDCNDGIMPCQRRWKFELPNKYITKEGQPEKTLDIGTWNLEALLPGESHDCIH